MISIDQIFTRLGGVGTVATLLDAPLGTVSAWKTRNSIPAEYWPSLIKVAGKLGIEGVTADALMKIAADNAAKRRPQPSEAAE